MSTLSLVWRLWWLLLFMCTLTNPAAAATLPIRLHSRIEHRHLQIPPSQPCSALSNRQRHCQEGFYGMAFSINNETAATLTESAGKSPGDSLLLKSSAIAADYDASIMWSQSFKQHCSDLQRAKYPNPTRRLNHESRRLQKCRRSRKVEAQRISKTCRRH